RRPQPDRARTAADVHRRATPSCVGVRCRPPAATRHNQHGRASARPVRRTPSGPRQSLAAKRLYRKEIPVKYTFAEALHEMRSLRGADAGRLRGVEVGYHLDELTDLDRLTAPWGTRLVELIEAARAGTITGDTPHYLVYSDLCRPRHKSDYAERSVMP